MDEMDLLELAQERANTAHTIFMLIDSDAKGWVGLEQACGPGPRTPLHGACDPPCPCPRAFVTRGCVWLRS